MLSRRFPLRSLSAAALLIIVPALGSAKTQTISDAETAGIGATITAAEVQPFVPYRTDSFSTGSVDGSHEFLPFGTNDPAVATVDYSAAAGAYLAHITDNQNNPRPVLTGLYSTQTDWMPYSEIGPERYVRTKYYVYTGGQSNPAALNSIPSLRLRAANRFAVSSILEVFSHLNLDKDGTSYSLELRPSNDPQNPSLYRVDLDPIDVPFLAENAETEGVLRSFEAYSIDPQDNGYLALTEAVTGTYEAAALPDSVAPAKVYAPGLSDAGNLAVRGTLSATNDLTTASYYWPPSAGSPLDSAEDPAENQPVYSEGPFGVTLSTMAVPHDRLAVMAREFNPGDDPAAPDYVRVEAGKQYKVRFHMTSTQNSGFNALIRLRGRAAKFAWIQFYQIGGAWAAGTQNNTLAQQALPGIGCLNPDKDGDENGGWYTMLMHSPLSADIRPEFPDGTPVSVRMPALSSEPGPGSSDRGRRDLQFGLDLIDSFSFSAYRSLEAGDVTLDRIEVRTYDMIPD